MAISDLIEKLGRAIFESPFTGSQLSAEQPEIAEIRIALLDRVKARSHRVGSQMVFADDIIRVELLGIPEEKAGLFSGDYFSEYLTTELKAGLRRADYRFPTNLRVNCSSTPRLPGPGEEWIQVTSEATPKPAAGAATAVRTARLRVVRGIALPPELVIDKARTNIGRTAEAFRNDGPSRRNDIAFVDDSAINRTVSREHAHIELEKPTQEYRLFNDRYYDLTARKSGLCGLWVIRDGKSHEVHRGPRGFKLQDGDEIQLGEALLSFHCGDLTR